jgi:nucleoside-diphosphate-sugar epimerase
MLNVLLTGHQGFIGRNVLNQINALEDDIQIIPYEGDIRQFDVSSLKGIDTVLHLAAMTGVRNSWKEPKRYWETNVIASKIIFKACFDRNIRVVYASSSSIYEWWLNPYATSKKAMEELAQNSALGLRFHTVYGENSRPDMLFDMLINNKVEYLTRHQRDFTHVNDVVDAIKIVLHTEGLHGMIDVGTSKPVSVVDVAKAFNYRDVPIKEVTGEREITLASIDTFQEMLGWSPKYDILSYIKNRGEE